MYLCSTNFCILISVSGSLNRNMQHLLTNIKSVVVFDSNTPRHFHQNLCYTTTQKLPTYFSPQRDHQQEKLVKPLWYKTRPTFVHTITILCIVQIYIPSCFVDTMCQDSILLLCKNCLHFIVCYVYTMQNMLTVCTEVDFILCNIV